MSGQHTPGPWKVGKELSAHRGEWLITMDCGDRGQGSPIAETRGATGDELENARLIAAAPDLLRSLIDCEARLALLVASGRSKMLDAVAAEQARAAIAKATGEVTR